MRFFKNKFFIILLAISVFATILTATLSVMGVTDPIKDLANTVSIPFRAIGNAISDSFDGFSRYFSSINKLEDEKEELENRIDELESMLADREAVIEENERLRDYLEIKKTYPDFKMTEALIIGREGDNNTTLLTLDKGRIDGIKVGMPIIVKEGLVGSVCEVGGAWCRVRLISEASASAGAYVLRSGETGIIDGDISLKGTGSCYLNYLDPDADIEVGDLVYTSGLGSVYPRGLFIGRVSAVESNAHLRTKEATVSLAVDADKLNYVLIITDFEVYSGD